MLTSRILGRQHRYLRERPKKDLTTALSGGIFVTELIDMCCYEDL